jgi:hypothetical protein
MVCVSKRVEEEPVPSRVRVELATLALEDAMADFEYLRDNEMTEEVLRCCCRTLVDSLNKTYYYVNKMGG